MWADAAGMFMRVGRSAYPFIIAYGVLAAAVAIAVGRARPRARPLSVAFWSAAFLPGLTALLSIAGFARAASVPRVGPEGNLFGMAVLGFLASLGVQGAIVGFVMAVAGIVAFGGRRGRKADR